MKIAVFCSLVVILLVAVQLCSAERRGHSRRSTRISWRGINHQRGRHNTNVNIRNFNYNYRGRQWTTNVRHNFRSRQTNFNANYRKNHNFNVGYNSRNRQANAGYTYRFKGRRRRSTEANYSTDVLKPVNDPKVFLEKLALLVAQFVKNHYLTVPELTNLSVLPVSDLTSNVTVAREVVCLVRKHQKILPRSLGNFIVKMIKFHGPSFNIEDLGDFFTVSSVAKKGEGDDFTGNEEPCDIPIIESNSEQKEIDSAELLEIKKFVASLVKVAMEYQLMLEE